MKKLLLFPLFFFLLLTFFAYKNVSFAQGTTPAPSEAPTAPSYTINDLPVNDNPELLYDLYKHPETRIDGNTRSVWIKFTNLQPNKAYYVCPDQDLKNCALPYKKLDKFTSGPDGTITMNVCGDGNDLIKGVQVQGIHLPDRVGGQINEKCKDSRDFFSEGHTYRASLYTNSVAAGDTSGNLGDRVVNSSVSLSPIISAQFFVAHSYPLVKLNAANPYTDPIEVKLWGRRPGGDNKNNYQVIIEGIDNKYKKEHCYTIPEKDWWTQNLTVGINTQFDELKNTVIPEFILNGTGFSIPTPRADMYAAINTYGRGTADESHGPLGKGTYILKVNERVSDNRPLGIGNNCEGGNTYMHVFFQIQSKGGIKILKVEYDPNDSDTTKIEKEAPAPPPPCADGELDPDTKTCKAFNVALLGKIQLEPLPFIKSLYTLVLSIAGLAAVVIIIRAGYKLMYSRGDKEMITDARSQITSAIIGLLFIIFAYVILSIIGVDILKIPGFSN